MSAIVEQQLRDMGFINVDVSSYSVLTSHPDMSRMSSLRTVNSDGQEVHLEVLYGSSEDATQDGGEMKTENQDRMRRMTDEGKEDGNKQSSTVMYMPFSATGQAEVNIQLFISLNCLYTVCTYNSFSSNFPFKAQTRFIHNLHGIKISA